MATNAIGDLVTVQGSGPEIDGIVFDMPSRTKVVVAVVDPGRGPRFRTVNPRALSPREAEGSDDPALRSLIRRTPPPAHGVARDAGAGVYGRSGFKRGSTHRPTGK
jgi:hypothetical protein